MPEQPEPFHAPLDIRRWARDAFGDEHALSPVQSAIGGAVLDSVWSLGVAEGRRLATEGWEREWGLALHGRGASCVLSERDARGIAAGCPDHLKAGVFSRLVGPWEPAPTVNAETLTAAIAEADWAERKAGIDSGQYQREVLGMWPGDIEPSRGGTVATQPAALPPVLLPDPDASRDVCPKSQRVDGPYHSTRWDGDDARTVCVFCGEVRDALSGAIIRQGDGGAR